MVPARAADVCDIGKIAVEQALVFIPKRQLPGPVQGLFAALKKRLRQFVIVAEHDIGL